MTDCERTVSERLQSLEQTVRGLVKQVKLYGLFVTLGTLIIPAYGQVSSVFADTRIEQRVSAQVERTMKLAIEQTAYEVMVLKDKGQLSCE